MKYHHEIQPHSSATMKAEVEEQLQQLRSRATELLFREDWNQYIHLYTHFISLCNHHLLQHPEASPSLHKSLSLAFSNRAEARYKLTDLPGALRDCNQALQINPTHLKSLTCKGKVLLDLDHYSQACECFRKALLVNKSDALIELLDRCKKLELQSRTGQIDLSDWLINGFNGKCPELAEYVGPVEIRRSENGRRGLFPSKSIEAGTPLVITKAVVLGRGILLESGNGSGENARMVMWKDFVDRILDAIERCSRTRCLIDMLSTGDEDEDCLKVPETGLFRPDAGEDWVCLENKGHDIQRILRVLDVNCLNEEAVSAKVLGKQANGCCGVGLWSLPSFVNHSCSPNVRRLHIGDWLVMHASRDLKAGEEITFPYFDVLLPLHKRRDLAKRWGFHCKCERCRFEEKEDEVGEMEKGFGDGFDPGEVVVRLEGRMKEAAMGKKEKGFLRASFWAAYSSVYESEKMMKRFGRKIPAEMVAAENVMDVAGGDERVLKVVLGSLKRDGGGCGNRWVEIERMMKMGRGVYGKVVRKQGMRSLFEQLNC